MVDRALLAQDVDGRLVLPEVRALFEKMRQYPIAGYDELGVEKARALVESSTRAQGEPRELPSVTDLEVTGRDGTDIPVRLYRTAAHRPNLIVYLHGGGWVTGSIDGSDPTCRSIADVTGCAVASVDYRRAPEFRYPVALHDGEDAMIGLSDRRADLALDESRLILMGDSAGAQLAISIAAGHPSLVTDLVALYPAISPPSHPFTGSWAANADDPVLSARTMHWFWQQYLGDDPESLHEIAAVSHRHRDLPRTLIATCGLDVLADEGLAFGDELLSAGVDVTRVHYEGMVHGFLSLAKFLPTVHEALRTLSEWLQQSGALDES